jgi:hypothetical protein
MQAQDYTDRVGLIAYGQYLSVAALQYNVARPAILTLRIRAIPPKSMSSAQRRRSVPPRLIRHPARLSSGVTSLRLAYQLAGAGLRPKEGTDVFQKARTLIVLICLTLGLTGAISAPAMATVGGHWFMWAESYPWTGKFDPGGAYALDQVTNYADAGNGWSVCAGAYDTPSASWAGTTVCANGWVSHPYCGCGSRIAWGGGGMGNTYVLQHASAGWR